MERLQDTFFTITDDLFPAVQAVNIASLATMPCFQSVPNVVASIFLPAKSYPTIT